MGNSRNPSILAAMAGLTNGGFAKHCLIRGGAGMVTIGGYPIGREMINASFKVAQRGRDEFLLPVGKEPEKILSEAHEISDFSRLIINLRLNSSKEAIHFARNFVDLLQEKPIIEINAHCRQTEIFELGGGQGLLKRFDVLTDIIKAFQSRDFCVSLKIRGNAIDPSTLIPQVKQWQLDFLHIDSYRNGIIGTDLDLLKVYSKKINFPVIGNNSVVDLSSAQAVLNTGAQFFSIARAARSDPTIFRALLKHF
ncbi:MAG: hypothetical protein JSW11_03620, partial [Candidatus Heimdallarchaeota archaeon]